MKNKGTLIFVGIAFVLTISVFIYFYSKNKGSKNGNVGNTGGGNAGGVNTGGSNIDNSYIGKDAYASRSGVKVYNADQSIYKTASNGEWVGKVYSLRSVHIPGSYDSNSNTWSSGLDINAYILGPGQYAKFVDKNDISLS